MALDWSPSDAPLFGQFFQNPNEEAKNAAMQRAAYNYALMRPEMAHAQLNAMRQQASLYQPINSALGEMYGPSAQMDINAALQNPMSERMMTMGMPQSPEEFQADQDRARKDRVTGAVTGLVHPFSDPLLSASLAEQGKWYPGRMFTDDGALGRQSYSEWEEQQDRKKKKKRKK